MQRWIQFFCLCLIINFLSACAPQRSYQYTPPVGKPALTCISQCKVASNSCMQICALKNSTCRREMQNNAANRYATYKMQRQAKGLPVQKRMEDFMRTTGCEHSCNCVPRITLLSCMRRCVVI